MKDKQFLTTVIIIGILDFLITLLFYIYKPIIGSGFFMIHYVENYGISFGLLADHQWLVYIGQVIVVYALYKLYKAGIRKESELGTILLFAGALSFILNRLIFGFVVDWMRFNIGSYSLINNTADIMIIIGILLIFYKTIVDKIHKSNRTIHLNKKGRLNDTNTSFYDVVSMEDIKNE